MNKRVNAKNFVAGLIFNQLLKYAIKYLYGNLFRNKKDS